MTNNPQSPNYPSSGQTAPGRLVTDRFDFQSHINGNNFRHTADEIDLGVNSAPTAITINGTPCHTVQQAIVAINSDLNPVIPDATTISPGLIQISGDLAGTYNSITVQAIQGKSIAATAPTSNQVLLWNGSSWTPTTLNNSNLTGLTLAGDITGTLGANVISTISGNGVRVTQGLSFTNGSVTYCQNGSQFNVTNGATLVATGASAIQVATAKGLVLAASQDFVQYTISHTRTIWNTFTILNTNYTGWTTNWTNQGFSLQSLSNVDAFPLIFKIDNLHNGATIGSLTISFTAATHSALPQYFPIVELYRVPLAANDTTITMVPGTALWSSTPPTLANYSGITQQFLTTFSSDNVIDTSSFIYYAVLFDESGMNAVSGNTYHGYSVYYENITSDQFP